jgi:hypothetical protein
MTSSIGVGPVVRASHCLATLRTLHAMEPMAEERILAHLPETVRRGLAMATTVDRVPATWDVALVEAIALELGPTSTRSLARATMLDSLRGPLLGTFLTGALRLFGASPGKLFGWAGRIWSHVTTGCGTMRLESAGDSVATLLLEGVPSEVATPVYLDAVAGTLEAVFVVCEVDGKVDMEPEPGGARFLARWTPTAPGQAPAAGG